MRRVAVTGLGAVTPLGNDAPSTWRAAVAGESGIDFIKSFDASEFPVRVAAEVKDFDPSGLVSPEGSAPARSQRAARRRGRDGGEGRREPERLRPGPGGRRLRLGDRRLPRDHGAERRPRRARARPCLAVLHPERARRLGERPDRDLARHARPELRSGLRLRDRVARCGRGSRAHPPRRRRRRPRGRHRGLHASTDPGRLLRDARPRGRGRASAARLTALRRHASGVRDGRRRLRSRSRGPRCCARARREGVRGGARLRRLERRLPHGRAGSRFGRSGRDDARCPRARARESDRRRLRQRARDVDPPGRPGGDEGAERRLRRPRVRAGGVLDEIDDGPLLRSRRRDRGDDVRARDPRGDDPAHDQLANPRSRVRSRLRPERGAPGQGRRGALERHGPRRSQRLPPRRRAGDSCT